MQVVKDLEIGYLRDDEWVFSGYSFTDTLWMGADGKLRTGPVDQGQQDNLWAVGFFNRVSRDAFIGLFLKHEAEGLPAITHSGAPVLHYRWHGPLWSRGLFQNARLAAGGVLRQKNAYLVSPFPERDGATMVEGCRNRLLHPLAVRPGRLPHGQAAAPWVCEKIGGCPSAPTQRTDLRRVIPGRVGLSPISTPAPETNTAAHPVDKTPGGCSRPCAELRPRNSYSPRLGRSQCNPSPLVAMRPRLQR